MRSRFALTVVSWLVLPIFLAAAPGILAQTHQGIFAPPIPNAPFVGVVHVERSVIQRDGTIVNLKTTRDFARDSRGRLYNIFRVLVPASDNNPPPIFRIHFYDPQTRIYTYLYPQRQAFWTGKVNHPPATEPADLYASPMGNSLPVSQFTKEEDLGTHTMDGLPVHGVRETQTIPAANNDAGKDIVVTDEYWYSDDLHMNLMIKHNDPRAGSVTMTVTQITQTEPDPGLFEIPAGYKPIGTAAGTGR